MTVNFHAPPEEFKDWNAYLTYWELETSLRHYNELPWKMFNDQLLDKHGFVEADHNG